MTNGDRYQLYYHTMVDCLKTFPLRSDGAEILRYFHVDDHNVPGWPKDLLSHFDTVEAECRLQCDKWLTQKNCVLNAKEKENYPFEIKVQAYVGSMIDAVASKTRLFANGFANKHWPNKFRSGESPAGLLQCIRNEYFSKVEAEKLSKGAVKTWKYHRTAAGITTTDKQAAEKLREQMLTHPFVLGWYPPEW